MEFKYEYYLCSYSSSLRHKFDEEIGTEYGIISYWLPKQRSAFVSFANRIVIDQTGNKCTVRF